MSLLDSILMTQGSPSAGEENMETITKPVLQPSNEKIQVVDRLAISITKRKRSTPQKFLGEFSFYYTSYCSYSYQVRV